MTENINFICIYIMQYYCSVDYLRVLKETAKDTLDLTYLLLSMTWITAQMSFRGIWLSQSEKYSFDITLCC